VTLEEIRGLATVDLQKNAADSREELFRKRYALISESVDNTRLVRELRKRVARIKTVLREREIAELAAAKAETAKAEGN
jgi:large subunit ribosomal protein L29